MIRALLAKSIGDAKWLFAAIFALMFFFPWVFLWASGMISVPAFSNFLASALPEAWQRAWGVPFSQVATPAGRAALVYVHPLIVFSSAVWTVARGSDCVSGEIGRGTMEMLLAQPVRRVSVYATQAVVTITGSALLASAVWCGTAIGLGMSPLYKDVSATLYLPPAVNLFGLMICLGGVSALVSSCDSQRWRTIGVIAAWYVVSTVLTVIGHIAERWHWLGYASIMSAYRPQNMVARSGEAWSLLLYKNGSLAGIGLGGQVIVLFVIGILCYVAGAFIFNRREIPAPL
jgi:beta-exotoxin I transport system permease protein